MEMKKEAEQVPLMNLIAVCGAQKILRKIAHSPFREKLLLRNNYYLGVEWYQNHLVDRLEFFSPEEEMAETIEGLIEEISSIETDNQKTEETETDKQKTAVCDKTEETETDKQKTTVSKKTEEADSFKSEDSRKRKTTGETEADNAKDFEKLKSAVYNESKEIEPDNIKDEENLKKEFYKRTIEVQVSFCKMKEQKGKRGMKNPCILLEIAWGTCQIPFELEIFPYKEHHIYPQEKILEEIFPEKEKAIYCKFPSEEYLSRGFYEILNSLELLNDLSWYQEIYGILTRESVNGRKVWDSFRRLLLEQPMPSVEKRLDTLKSYEGYWYMEKKWNNQCVGEKEEYPQWNQVIQLFGKFFTPIFEGVMKDEVFIGDWMPQLGRYLD